MPELPEVETVCRGLAPHVEGKRIAHALVRNPNLRQKIPSDFVKKVTGLQIGRVSRRAKYVLFACDRNITLICHLGMSGSLTLRPQQPSEYRPHEHVMLSFANGPHLMYHDPRRFGLMLYCSSTEIETHPLFCALGPEPLGRNWTAKVFHASLQSRHSPIKTAIMDQKLVVGVGNIYACEALFAAGIHPTRPASAVTPDESARLHKAVRDVLKAAIASGGSTLRDYVRSSGDPGYFQHRFRVYGRQNLPCPTCNTPIAQMKQSGRSSFFCSTCQC